MRAGILISATLFADVIISCVGQQIAIQHVLEVKLDSNKKEVKKAVAVIEGLYKQAEITEKLKNLRHLHKELKEYQTLYEMVRRREPYNSREIGNVRVNIDETKADIEITKQEIQSTKQNLHKENPKIFEDVFSKIAPFLEEMSKIDTYQKFVKEQFN
ncbi:hypothetical protein DdX_14686 [Ditylenchus destructor]|uniref:Uncharacterized protein n=1 Tax=Ditylenchus destructor TaxID=166010 RepID=A0AAD4MRN4_9BILA|nr:hypothetical protein DdX_14686 [Ditylenchus destructor]